MVVLVEMIGEKIISGFRGTIDFYYCRGIPCARMWPRKPSGKRSPAVQAQWPPFQEAAQLAGQLDRQIIGFFTENAVGTNMTWKDLHFRAYMSGLPTEVYTGKD